MMIIFRTFRKTQKHRRLMESIFDLNQFSYSRTKKKPGATISSATTQNKTPTPITQLPKTKKLQLVSQELKEVAVFKKILKWRAQNEAPVDVVGCERLHDPSAPIQIQKFQTLVALMLSVQTKDETTAKVMGRLKEKGLYPKSILKYSEEQLRELIYESNFNRRKASNLIKVAEMVQNSGAVANTLEGLLKYPGVGVKIAMIYLKVAEGKVEGIGVDTHVHRIANRLHWVKTDTPEQTEQQLRELFPFEVWGDMNICLVGFGQIRCAAKAPLCKGCPVESECPSFKLKW